MKTMTLTIILCMTILLAACGAPVTESSAKEASSTVAASTKVSSGRINCEKLLSADEVAQACGTPLLVQKQDEAIEGKYNHLCSRSFVSKNNEKQKFLSISIVKPAGSGIFEAHAQQYVDDYHSGKMITGVGDKAFQFKDGKTNRIEFSKKGLLGNLEARKYAEGQCTPEQLQTLATTFAGKM